MRALLRIAARPLSSAPLPRPEPNWAALLDPSNTDRIRDNCRHRKSAGDIDRVLLLHKTAEQDPSDGNHRALLEEALKIPNWTHPNTPIGSESQARILEEHFPLPSPSPRGPSAVSIGKSLGQLRLDNVSLTAGHRTYFFVGGLAVLERALVQFALSRLVGPGGAGFRQISVPDVLPAGVIERCGFPTRGVRNQVYHVEGDEPSCLAGTAEMSLAGCFAGRAFKAADLPLRLCAVSRCFRREVPEQEEPLYRVHQFTKVEMFGIAAQTGSLLEEFVRLQIGLLRDLGLQFRVLEMPTEELGAPAHRKIDIEVWMPGSDKYGEVSSASDCLDFQSRRLHLRIGTGSFAQTVNATAAAVPRLVKAVLETHVGENGQVAIPEILWPWMGKHRILQRQHPPVASTYIKKLLVQ